MSFPSKIKNKIAGPPSFKPLIFDTARTLHRYALEKLFDQGRIKNISDDFESQVKELFEIKNPWLIFNKNFASARKNYLTKLLKAKPLWQQGRWVYFPWSASAVHVLNEADFYLLRTARNRDLITAIEQKKFYNFRIGVAGLSVGNSAALAIVLQGGGRHVKLADPDSLALSNTNRIRSSLTSLGLPKVVMTARQIYEINPYAKVEIYPQGLDEKNVGSFCRGLDLVIDEVDNLAAKYLLRVQAKKLKLPVVMAADNGDNGIIDVERYDFKKQPAFFHGRLPESSYKKLLNLNKFQTGKLITVLLGLENVTPRMQLSLTQMGKTLVSWPQLGGAALLNGSAVAYCARKIAAGDSLINGRAIVSLDEKLRGDYFSKKQTRIRQAAVKKFKQVFKIE